MRDNERYGRELRRKRDIRKREWGDTDIDDRRRENKLCGVCLCDLPLVVLTRPLSDPSGTWLFFLFYVLILALVLVFWRIRLCESFYLFFS